MYIANDKSENPTTDFFDMNFNHLPFRMKDPNSLLLPTKPRNFDIMLNLCEELCHDMPFVRLDFYETNNNLYFGEFTFYHAAGFSEAQPNEYNLILGELINLP